MNRIKVVFKTTDDLEHDSMDKALEHQSTIDFDTWYEKDPLPGISLETYKKWARKHKDSIEEL